MGAECAAGVAGIVGALGEVAASGTLAMTSCKEFPMAGVANGRGWGGQRTQAHKAAVMFGGSVVTNEKMPLLQPSALQVSVPTPIMLAVSVPTPSKRTPVALLLQLCHRHGEDDLISYVCRSVSKMSEH